MEFDSEKVIVSLSSVGKVTKASRTPKRAKGVFIPPIGSSPRRSPRLLAKGGKLIMVYVAMAISRSPAAYNAVRSLGILQLPCNRTLKKYMKQHSTFPGINEESFYQAAQRFAVFKANRLEVGFTPPVQEGILVLRCVTFFPPFI